MIRPLFGCLLSCGLLVLLTGERAIAQVGTNPNAQYGTYAKPPLVSPYLQLGGANNPAVNYFLRVVPDVQRPAMINQFNNTIVDLERRLAQPAATTTELLPTLTGTGHAAQFMSYSPYYSYGQTNTSASTAIPLNAGVRSFPY